MESLIAGLYVKEDLIKKGLTEEQIKEAVRKPHGSAFQVETWFTILNSFTNKIIKSDGYYYAIRRHPASVLVAAILESMNSARVAQGGIPEEEPARSKALQSALPYILTMAHLVREDSYSGSKLWDVDTVELANRAIKRTLYGVLPTKNVEGKNYFDDKIDMFVEYVGKDLTTVPIFKDEVEAAKKTYGDIASHLNVGGVSGDNKAVQLFMNTFRKPSDSLVAERIKHLLLEEECHKLELKEAKKIAKGVYSDKLKKLKADVNHSAVRLQAIDLLG